MESPSAGEVQSALVFTIALELYYLLVRSVPSSRGQHYSDLQTVRRNASMKEKFKLFIPGQRLIRTVMAVFLCMLVYEARSRRGMPVYGTIAAVMCIQPYTGSMAAIARRRIVGTLIGAGWGILILLSEQYLLGMQEPDGLIHYIIAALGCGVVIYFAVWLNLAEMAQFAAIVFLIVVITQAGNSNVFLYGYHRTVDTFIGIVIGECVNRIHLPRMRNTDTLFASGISNTIFTAGKKLSGFSLVELNRLIEDGCKFTVMTVDSPASVRELLRDVQFRLPIIAMDGSVLYDLNERRFLRTVLMAKQSAAKLCTLLDAHETEFFQITQEQELIIIRHGELRNDAIKEVYERKRVSPYRNYALRIHDTDYHDKTIYFLILDKTEKVEKVINEINQAPWAGTVRIRHDTRNVPDGYRCIRVFPAEADKESMLTELRKIIGAKKTVTFGYETDQYDVVIKDADKDLMVKKLKRRFEPVSLKGWQNMFIRG